MKLNRMLLGLTTICGFSLSPLAFAGHGHEGAMAHFKAMDTNGDGKLSPDEHHDGARKMWEAMDGDKDGKVTAAEMTAAHDQIKGKKAGKMEMSAAEKIKVLDTDGDGALTAAEHAVGAKQKFEQMDTNKDGFLSKQEKAAGHKMMMKKGGKHHSDAAKD
jgi:hypothetical protein